MLRLALVIGLVSLASAANPANAQPPATAPSTSLVFVYDGGSAHVSGERVRRALAAGLHRPVLRLTDEGASAAVGRVTVAFSPPDRWVVDFVRGETHASRTITLRSSTVSSLARVAMSIIADAEPVPTTVRASSVAQQRGEWIALIGDEILDPFRTQPVPTRRRTMALLQELVDPFGPPGAGRRGYDDVIDPWSH